MGKARLELSDLAAYVQPRDPQLSPAGDRVVVLLARPDLEANVHVEELVVIDVATGARRALGPLPPRARHARWSPAGDRLAVLAADPEDRLQLYVADADGGEFRQLTRAARGVLQFAWRPDGRAFAYLALDEEPARSGPERHDRSFEVGDDSYLARGTPPRAQLWVVSDDGEATALTRGSPSVCVATAIPGDARPFDWSPDGRTLVFLTQAEPHPAAMIRLALEAIDLDDGRRRVLVPGPRALANPRFSPCGRKVAFQAPAGPEPLFTPSALFVVSPDGSGERALSAALDRDVAGAWLPDGDALLAKGFDGTRHALWRLPLVGEPARLGLGDVDPISSVSVGADGALVFAGVRPHAPAELFHLGPDDDAPRALTALNAGWSDRDLGAVETVRWPGPDGGELDGVLVTPPGFAPGQRYPLVLSLHGGPMGTSTVGFHGLHQLLAARGWLVFSPNYRGSNNAGLAFQRSIVGDPARGPERDIMSGVEALRARGIVDDARTAVTGWSYGGYLAAWLTTQSTAWRAAVAGAPVTDWIDAYALSDLNTFFGLGLGGSPWRDDRAAAYRDASPITHAHQIRTPTLILACTGDDRVPVTHAYKLYRALRDNDVPVRFVAYPVAAHYPTDPVHQREVSRRWVGWLAEHLGE